MVMVLPAMVPVAVAGGLSGGAFCWAIRVVAASKRPVQTKMCFMVMLLLRAEPCFCWDGPDAMIVAPHGYVAKAACVKSLL
jgi:hypothetical protein